MEQRQAILVLADGTTCYGKAFGAIGTTGGEICFNTGMTGYQEVFTDPSYYGQVLIMNAVHVVTPILCNLFPGRFWDYKNQPSQKGRWQ